MLSRQSTDLSFFSSSLSLSLLSLSIDLSICIYLPSFRRSLCIFSCCYVSVVCRQAASGVMVSRLIVVLQLLILRQQHPHPATRNRIVSLGKRTGHVFSLTQTGCVYPAPALACCSFHCVVSCGSV